MRKVSLLLASLLVLSTVLVIAAPQSVALAAPPPHQELAAPGGPFASPADQFCTILCVIGKHCCVVGGHQTCIPNGLPCVAQ